ncbi:hypothetical protein V8E53_010975 [Lactarius tabidus]
MTGLSVSCKMCQNNQIEVQTLSGSALGHANKRRRLCRQGGECKRCSEEKGNGNRKDEHKVLSRSNVLRLSLVMGWAKASRASVVRSTEPVVLAALPITTQPLWSSLGKTRTLYYMTAPRICVRTADLCLCEHHLQALKVLANPKVARTTGRRHNVVGRGHEGGHRGAVPGNFGGGTHGRREQVLMSAEAGASGQVDATRVDGSFRCRTVQ